MTFTEARKILGLGPDEDPRPLLADFRRARERIAEIVRNETDAVLAASYQDGLIEFDRAIAALREHLESLEIPEVPSAPSAPLIPSALSAQTTPPRRWRWLAWLGALGIAAACAAALYLYHEQDKALRIQARITRLERAGSSWVENRRWQEAADAFAEIENLSPGSPTALLGRRSIEAGMAEEQAQFVAYWTGQAVAELETGRLDEAQVSIRRVLEKFPNEKEATAVLTKIGEAQARQAREAAIAAARKLLDERQWEAAIAAARAILATSPDDADARNVLIESNDALAKFTADQRKARELLNKALARDHGQFDQLALDWLREAAALAPDDKEIAARLEKMASYTRTLRVPEDYATPAEALAAAHERDRIVLAENTWKGPLVIHTAVDLEGAGSSKTTVECPASDGCPITIGPQARGVRVSGITFRHESFLATGKERFSAALVSGGSATFVACKFSDASGHGLVVIDKGEATASRCRFSDNGWNGAAVTGAGSSLTVRESEALDNFQHGIESWSGAAVTLVNNRCEGNCLNGIHVDNGVGTAGIEGNQLVANREFGLVLNSAGSGKITGNTARANLLGGFVIRAAAAKTRVTRNEATLNQGPGLVLEKGLPAAAYADNILSKNLPTEVLTDVDLSGN